MGTMIYALTRQAEKAATQQATTELRAGAAVARKTLEFRGQQLSNAAHILIADFGFKEAVASGDHATLLSALANHATRIKAGVAAVFDVEGNLLVTTPGEFTGAGVTALRSASTATQDRVIYRLIDGAAYQLVVATVHAPEPIAVVVIGFALDANLAREIAHVVAVDVQFAWWDGSRFDSTDVSRSPALDLRRDLVSSRTAYVVTADHDKALVQRESLPIDSGVLDIVLHSSLDIAGQSYWKLRNAILWIGGSFLLIAALGGVVLARAATRPITALTAAAERIQRGDYSPATPTSVRSNFASSAPHSPRCDMQWLSVSSASCIRLNTMS